MHLHEPPTRPSRRSRASAGVVGALLLGLALAACGGGAAASGVLSLQDPSGSANPTGSPAAFVDPEDAMEAFAACMREHGVDVQVSTVDEEGRGEVRVGVGGNPATGPAGEAQPNGRPPAEGELAEADEACRHLLPAGGMGDPNATMDPAMADAMLEFARCMREHDIDFPDPVFEGGGVTMQVGGPEGPAFDPTSDAFREAQEACAAAMPDGAPFMVGGQKVETAP